MDITPRHLKAAHGTEGPTRRAALALMGAGLLAAGASAGQVMKSPAAAQAHEPQVAPFHATPGAAARTPSTSLGPVGSWALAVDELNLHLHITPATVVDDAGASGGHMVIPETPGIGWLKSTAPLDATDGVSLLAGHVDWPDGKTWSPMSQIGQIAAGTLIRLGDSTGTEHRYQAASLTQYVKTHLPDSLFAADGPRRLVLVTCGGPLVTFADGRVNYRDNTVVVATPT